MIIVIIENNLNNFSYLIYYRHFVLSISSFKTRMFRTPIRLSRSQFILYLCSITYNIIGNTQTLLLYICID